MVRDDLIFQMVSLQRTTWSLKKAMAWSIQEHPTSFSDLWMVGQCALCCSGYARMFADLSKENMASTEDGYGPSRLMAAHAVGSAKCICWESWWLPRWHGSLSQGEIKKSHQARHLQWACAKTCKSYVKSMVWLVTHQPNQSIRSHHRDAW